MITPTVNNTINIGTFPLLSRYFKIGSTIPSVKILVGYCQALKFFVIHFLRRSFLFAFTNVISELFSKKLYWKTAYNSTQVDRGKKGAELFTNEHTPWDVRYSYIYLYDLLNAFIISRSKTQIPPLSFIITKCSIL